MKIDIGYYPKATGNMVEEKKEADSIAESLLKRANKKKVRVLSSGTVKQGFEPNAWYEGKLSIETEDLKVLVELADELSKRLRPATFGSIGISVNR